MKTTFRPTVSIVTPSYNMAQYLGEAVGSVLSQDYREVEYVVMDGGSTDGSVAILERYKSRLRYISTADKGTADALNRGFLATRGEILGWLNADDIYMPGAINTAVDYLMNHPDVAAVYGQGYWADEHGRILGPYPTHPYDPMLLRQECFICQPTCFFRRSALEQVGMLDDSLHFAFDYDLWIRLSTDHRFAMVSNYIAISRMHRTNKTLGQRGKALRESIGVLKRHYSYVPFNWVYTYCSYVLDKRDQFYEALRPSRAAYLLSLLMGMWYNRKSARQFWQEWLSVMYDSSSS